MKMKKNSQIEMEPKTRIINSEQRLILYPLSDIETKEEQEVFKKVYIESYSEKIFDFCADIMVPTPPKDSHIYVFSNKAIVSKNATTCTYYFLFYSEKSRDHNIHVIRDHNIHVISDNIRLYLSKFPVLSDIEITNPIVTKLEIVKGKGAIFTIEFYEVKNL
jgi:hypothetical protein